MSRPPEFPPAALGHDAGRRALIKRGAALLVLVSPFASALAAGARKAPSLLAVRVWPAVDYTRVTLEHDLPIRFSHFSLRSPERLVVDIEGLEFNAVLENLPGQIGADDPYIKGLRAGRFKPGVVRLVMDLKTEVAPQVFNLLPVADYGHRLVLDIYPANPPDPMLALLKKSEQGGGPDLHEANDALEDKIAELARRGAVGGPPTGPPSAAPGKSPGEAGALASEASDQGRGAVAGTAGERARGENGQRSSPAKVDRLITIVLDPGHGGEDPGAIGRRGSREKNVTLALARRLKARIDAEPNMRALLTRDADFFVSLDVRVNKARRVQADLFVSIHADAWIKPNARGSSVFVLSQRGASSAAARWLADKENAADLIGGANAKIKDKYLARTLLDLSQSATNKDSLKLGKTLLGEIGQVNRLHRAHVEHAGFAVLKAPDIPSVLIETAFISNPEEEKRLVDERYQNSMADALMTGIRRYFAKNPPGPKSPLALL